MERNELEKHLRKLQELDEQFSDDSELSAEFMSDLNKVIKGMTEEMQLDVVKKASGVELKYINSSNNPDPDFAHEGDSGFDLRAFINKDVTINEWRVVIIPTGLYVEVEKGLEVQVRTRSGMAANSNMFVLNSPGTVDSRYRGEIQVILANFTDTPHVIRNGDRIAQGVVCPVYGEGALKLNKVEKLSESKRNTDGLGSTGVT